MGFTYKGKPIFPTKTALNELSEIDVNLYEVPEILEKALKSGKERRILLKEAFREGIK